MNNDQNIIKQFLKTLIITMVLSGAISNTTIYLVSKDNFNHKLANKIKKHVDRGLDKAKDNLSSKAFLKHIKRIDFTIFEIYDKNKQELSSFFKDTKNIKQIKKYYLNANHIFPTTKETKYDFFEIQNDQFYIFVFHPIYKNNKLLGYLKGVKKIDDSVVKEFEHNIYYTLIIILISIIIFSLFIFPLIYIAYKQLNLNRVELMTSHLLTIRTLGNAIALKDSDTNEHNYRVTIYSVLLAQELNLQKEQIQELMIGAFLHDVGKIGISDNILLKQGKLTNDEFEIMKQHVQKGISIVKGNNWLEKGIDVIYSHHEKYDGSGYPKQISKEKIPKIARIFSIIDVFDALTSKRPYKQPFSYEKAINILKESSDTHFDPEILDIFIKISDKLYTEVSNKSQEGLRNSLDNLIRKYFL